MSTPADGFPSDLKLVLCIINLFACGAVYALALTCIESEPWCFWTAGGAAFVALWLSVHMFHQMDPSERDHYAMDLLQRQYRIVGALEWILERMVVDHNAWIASRGTHGTCLSKNAREWIWEARSCGANLPPLHLPECDDRGCVCGLASGETTETGDAVQARDGVIAKEVEA